MKYIFQALKTAAILAEWSATALSDGRVTTDEVADLVNRLFVIFDLPTAITVADTGELSVAMDNA